MGLKSRNKITTEFNMSSMTDLVFLLLIFFMLLSTLITNQVIMDVTLPESSSKTRPQEKHTTVSLSADMRYKVDGKEVAKEDILNVLRSTLGEGSPETKVQLAVDEGVTVKYFLELTDIIWVQGRYRVLIAAQPKPGS